MISPVGGIRTNKNKFMIEKFEKLKIPDIILITFKAFEDKRGSFAEIYKETEFKNIGIKESFVQDNYVMSKKGVIRGLHFQKHPHAQSKLISCIKGRIFDVTVDVRKNSPSFGKWVGVFLDEKENRVLYIPDGFAHGYEVVSETALVIYKVSKEYAPQSERGINFMDPNIKIAWSTQNPIVSLKDKNLAYLDELPDEDLL